MNTGSVCAFDTLFTRSVPHVLEKIFLSLDSYESFQKCLEASKKWKEVLNSESFQEKAKTAYAWCSITYFERATRVKEIYPMPGVSAVLLTLPTVRDENSASEESLVEDNDGRSVVNTFITRAGVSFSPRTRPL